MKKLILALGLLVSLNASATGGIWCEVDKNGLKFEFNAVTSHGFEADIVEANAALSGKLNQTFVKTDIRQYWNEGKDLRLNLYAETESGPLVSTTVVIKTKRKNDFEYAGTISVTRIADGVETKLRESITCSQE